MSRRRLVVLSSLLVFLTTNPTFVLVAHSQTRTTITTEEQSADDEARSGTLAREVDALETQIKNHKDRIQELNSQIEGYRKKAKEQQSAALTLQNQLALLENNIQEGQLQIERTKKEIDLTNSEIQRLTDKIRIQELVIAKRQASLAELVRHIRQTDQVSPLYVFLTKPSFSEYFARLDEVRRLQDELVQVTELLKTQKKEMERFRTARELDRSKLVDREHQYRKDILELEETREAKLSLIDQTENKEEVFQRVVYELRQQQQSESAGIASLQDRLRENLNQADSALARGDSTLQWPLTPKKGVSARFHDTTYPFRNLFEHPGMDLPAPVGTPIKAAAGGYIAWTRTGKQYGNYIMVVHAGGIATVYAHLSRFAVKPDTYVERGEVIGYSGGRPGDQGAGLSTGPHLHFEVRQNGIPVNPENFLSDAPF